jgi:hypothetical protein
VWVEAPIRQASKTMRDCCAAMLMPHAPLFPAVRSHLPKVQRQQTSQYGM